MNTFINSVDVLMAMQWPFWKCNNSPTSVIASCFKLCLKQSVNSGTDKEKGTSETAFHSMERDVNEHGVQITCIWLNCIANQEKENNTV